LNDLFNSLDLSKKGVIEYSEFVSGCLNMKETHKSNILMMFFKH